MKELSSPLTFFYKFVFPLLWFVGFAAGAREVLFFSPAYDTRWLQYMAMWLGVTVFIYFTTGNIKKIGIDGKKLHISNYLRSESIDLSSVEKVDGSSFLSPRLVWLDLAEKSPFGRKIVFLPRRRGSAGFGKHPVVAELREQLGLED